MRLTEEVFRQSDNYHDDLVRVAFRLGACGRFGLLPASRPFRLSLDCKKNYVEVESLDCLGITRDGSLIDASFDSDYTRAHDTRADFHPRSEDSVYILLVATSSEWADVDNGACVPVYRFSIVEEHAYVPDNALPIARIVYDNMVWREDEQSFVPPCMLVASHSKYQQQLETFQGMLSELDVLVPQRLITDGGAARSVFWPVVRRLVIDLGVKADTLSPLELFGLVQECVSGFCCACFLDETLQLSDAEDFLAFTHAKAGIEDCFLKISEGIELIKRIHFKLVNLEKADPKSVSKVPILSISAPDLLQNATSNNVQVPVFGLAPGVTGYYSLDGMEPTIPLSGGRFVKLNPGFNKTRTKEKDRTYQVRLKAEMDGRSGEISTYNVVVVKNVKVWSGPEI